MLWTKTLLEIRWRLAATIAVAFCFIAYFELAYPIHLKAWVEMATAAPVAFDAEDLRAQAEAEFERDLAVKSIERSFDYLVYRAWFRDTRSIVLIGGAILVGLIGIGGERSRRTIMATLSLPLRRWHLVLSQATTGILALAAMTLAIDVMALAAAAIVGETLPVTDVLRFSLFAIVGQAAMFSITLLASTILNDWIKPAALALLLAMVAKEAFGGPESQFYNLFYYMGGHTYFHSAGLCAWVTLGLVLITLGAVVAAVTVAQVKEY